MALPARRGGLRWLVYGSTSLVMIVVSWLVWCVWFIMYPATTSRPTHADAIVVLGPYLEPRRDEALALARRLDIGEIAFSVGDTPGQIRAQVCVDPPPGVHVTCFVPSPYSTRGEARELGALADAGRWTDVIVLAPRAQVSRARMLIGRCYSGTLQMVQAPGEYDLNAWIYEFFHQSGGVVKALLAPTC